MSAGPLAGIRIVDLTRVLAGPFCTLILAELGAEIIKVEHPNGGDDARSIGPFIGDKSAYFMSLNRGKLSIALNLKNNDDREYFRQLVKSADVLVENYRPGTMDKLGFDWPTLQSLNPALIYAAISGFGQTGPYAKRAAYDMVVQGMGGIMSLTGYPDTPPTRVGTSIGDSAAGMYAAIGIVSALFERNNKQRQNLSAADQLNLGKKIDISMLDCQVALLENAISRFDATGEIPGPLGSRHPSITPFQAFATQTGYITVAAGNDRLFKRLTEILGCTDIADDQRYRTNEQRNAHHAALEAALMPYFQAQPADYWLSALDQAGIPCGPINNVADIMQDPQIQARNMIVAVEDDQVGTLRMSGNPIKMNGLDDSPRRDPAPKLDQDREQILRHLEAIERQ